MSGLNLVIVKLSEKMLPFTLWQKRTALMLAFCVDKCSLPLLLRDYPDWEHRRERTNMLLPESSRSVA
jgi:hypothetical protein